jgi:hypothetical protein
VDGLTICIRCYMHALLPRSRNVTGIPPSCCYRDTNQRRAAVSALARWPRSERRSSGRREAEYLNHASEATLGFEPVWGPNERPQLCRAIGRLGHSRKVEWSDIPIDYVQGQDFILRMMDWAHAPLVGHRVDQAVLPGSSTAVAPIILYHPEECVVVIAPNSSDLGSAAHPGCKFARDIGTRPQQVLDQQHIILPIGTALPDGGIQIVKKKGPIS